MYHENQDSCKTSPNSNVLWVPLEYDCWIELAKATGSHLKSGEQLHREEVNQPLKLIVPKSKKSQQKIPKLKDTDFNPKSSKLNVLCEAINYVSKIDMMKDASSSNVEPDSKNTGYAKNADAPLKTKKKKASPASKVIKAGYKKIRVDWGETKPIPAIGKTLKAPCKVCNKNITTNNMTSHMRIHLGTWPYTCYMCGGQKKFRYSGDLYRHLKNIHRLSDFMLAQYKIIHKTGLFMRKPTVSKK